MFRESDERHGHQCGSDRIDEWRRPIVREARPHQRIRVNALKDRRKPDLTEVASAWEAGALIDGHVPGEAAEKETRLRRVGAGPAGREA